MRAFDERAERTTASTALRPATRRATGAGMRRGRPDAQLGGRQRHEVVVGDRLVVGDVVDAPVRGLVAGREQDRRRDVLDVHHVPEVRAAADHREAPRLAQARHELLAVPAAGAVDVRGADHDSGQPALQHHALALLLGAPVRRLDRKRGVLRQQPAARVAGDDRRGEDEPRRRSRQRHAGVEQPSRPRDVHLGDLRGDRAARRSPRPGAPRSPVAPARAPASSPPPGPRSPVTAVVPGGSEPGRRTSAVTSCPALESRAGTRRRR